MWHFQQICNDKFEFGPTITVAVFALCKYCMNQPEKLEISCISLQTNSGWKIIFLEKKKPELLEVIRWEKRKTATLLHGEKSKINQIFFSFFPTSLSLFFSLTFGQLLSLPLVMIVHLSFRAYDNSKKKEKEKKKKGPDNEKRATLHAQKGFVFPGLGILFKSPDKFEVKYA